MISAMKTYKQTEKNIIKLSKKQLKEIENLIKKQIKKGLYYCLYNGTLYSQTKSYIETQGYKIIEKNNQVEITWNINSEKTSDKDFSPKKNNIKFEYPLIQYSDNYTKTFGYCRVSSTDQNEDRQIQAMLDLGINERDVFIDKCSGKNFERPQYQALKLQLREGDILVIKSIDR